MVKVPPLIRTMFGGAGWTGTAAGCTAGDAGSKTAEP
jgi:hypothetical protein